MTWFKREKKPIEAVVEREDRRIVTEGLWIKCSGCKEPLWKKDLEANVQVCPKCSYHYKITAHERLNLLLDEGWQEYDASLYSTDPLDFKANKPYKDTLRSLPPKIGVREAVVDALGKLARRPGGVFAAENKLLGGPLGLFVVGKHPPTLDKPPRNKPAPTYASVP